MAEVEFNFGYDWQHEEFDYTPTLKICNAETDEEAIDALINSDEEE